MNPVNHSETSLAGRAAAGARNLTGPFVKVTLAQLVCACVWLVSGQGTVAADDPEVKKLAVEVGDKGWILYTSKTAAGDYDLFLTRPDGTQARNLTQTPQFSEFGAKYSPDGKKVMYRRTAKGVEVNHDLWGATGVLVIADRDGANPVALGEDGEYPWTSWGTDSQQIASLYKRQGKIRIFDLATKAVVKEFLRQGIFQQLYWSPDGKKLCGTANIEGQDWNIVSIDIATGQSTLLSRALNCTPDWFQKDPNRVIYSNRTPGIGSEYGFTMLMWARADGKERSLIYGEKGKHIYYGCTSPDDRYAVFSFPESDGGTDAHMAIVRMADAPIIVPEDYKELRELYPAAKSGPVLRLDLAGFEPQWTFLEAGGK